MELRHIEAFLKVVERESFSLAAEDLFTTQPTISMRIQQLERTLDTQLFKRTSGKKVALTEDGKIILPYFEEAYSIINNGIKHLQKPKIKPGKLTISSPNYMSVEVMPEFLNLMYTKFPNIEFTVKVLITDEVIKRIRAGELDMGFAYLTQENECEDFSTFLVANEENLLICKPDHPLVQKTPLSVRDLSQERIIFYHKQFPTTKIVEQYLAKHGMINYESIEISHLGWIKKMLKKGIGIAFLQKIVVMEELKNNTLVALPLLKPLPPTPVYLVSRSNFPDEIKEHACSIAHMLFKQSV